MDENFKLAADGGFVTGFGVGDDVKIRVFLHQAQELGEVGGVILVGNEVGEEVGTGEGLGLVGGGLTPGRWVVGEDKVIIVGESEVNFKNAVTEGIIEQEGIGGVGVGVTVDAAEGMGDVGMLGPRVVKLVGGGGERWVRRSRVIYWGGGDYLEDEKDAKAEQHEDGADDGDEGGAREMGL